VGLAAVAGSLGWAARDRAAQKAAAEQGADLAMQEAAKLQERGKFAEALLAANRAEGLLLGGPGGESRPAPAGRPTGGLRTILRFEEILLEQAEVKNDKFDIFGSGPLYAKAFQEYGLDVASLDLEELVKRIERSPIREHLLEALDDWIVVQLKADEVMSKR